MNPSTTLWNVLKAHSSGSLPSEKTSRSLWLSHRRDRYSRCATKPAGKVSAETYPLRASLRQREPESNMSLPRLKMQRHVTLSYQRKHRYLWAQLA